MTNTTESTFYCHTASCMVVSINFEITDGQLPDFWCHECRWQLKTWTGINHLACEENCGEGCSKDSPEEEEMRMYGDDPDEE